MTRPIFYEEIFIMKKHLTRLLAFLLFVATLASMPLTGYADTGINNTIKGTSNKPTTSVAAGKNLLLTASNAKKIDHPNASDYFAEPFPMYVNAPKEHSVYVYDTWEAADVDQIGTTYHGGRVTVLAEHGEFYCILFHTETYELKAAWVRAVNLTSWYPGYSAALGSKSNRLTYNAGDPELKWSKEYFVGTKRKFSILKMPIENCMGFTLDYQLVSNNGAGKEAGLGPRTVYVNDGSGWIYVGTFEYDKPYAACHIDISLDTPMTLAAVATVADCAQPDTFIFRQSVLDIMCTK